MSTRNVATFLGFGFALVILAGQPALADAIDGDWCTVDGRQHMTIDGPKIITPGGKQMEGDYSRHGFAYIVPPPEAGSGQTIRMTLVNEDTVQSRLTANGAASESPTVVWRRCKRPVS